MEKNTTPTLDLLSDEQIRTTWERCNNCDRQYPEEADFQLCAYYSFYPKQYVTHSVCNSCAIPRKVFYTDRGSEGSLRHSVVTYEGNEMLIGFGPTEPAAVMDLRERFAERFNRDIVNFQRG